MNLSEYNVEAVLRYGEPEVVLVHTGSGCGWSHELYTTGSGLDAIERVATEHDQTHRS